jgi:hypothetical protein
VLDNRIRIFASLPLMCVLARRNFLVGLMWNVIASGSFISTPTLGEESWHFVVSGDSRNCGDVVMPSVAAGAHTHDARFYWHLGDWRAIYDFDEDFRILHPTKVTSVTDTWASRTHFNHSRRNRDFVRLRTAPPFCTCR